MANIKDKMLYFVGNKLLKYVYKNPQKNMLKLIKIGKAVAGKMYPESTFYKAYRNYQRPYQCLA